jgi:hypothetical protein
MISYFNFAISSSLAWLWQKVVPKILECVKFGFSNPIQLVDCGKVLTKALNRDKIDIWKARLLGVNQFWSASDQEQASPT